MQYFTTIAEAVGAVRAFERALPSGLSDHLTTRLASAAAEVSPVAIIYLTAEVLYANREELDDDAKRLCAGLAAFATLHGYCDLANGRGTGIIQAMLRDVGEPAPTGSWPAADQDPPANIMFAKLDPALLPRLELPAEHAEEEGAIGPGGPLLPLPPAP